MLRRQSEKGVKLPRLAIADHDFPLGPRMTLSLSGWVQCALRKEGDRMDASQMYAFARPNRYVPKSAGANLHDLLEAITADKEPFDTLLLVSDNAADYSQDV